MLEVGEDFDEGSAESIPNLPPNPQKNQPPLYLMNPPKNQKDGFESNEFIEIPIPLKDGRKARLMMPEGYSDEDIIKVHRVVTGYLP